MRFLVDAQLPRRMTDWLSAGGCDAIHTFELPDANRTTDEKVCDIAERDSRALITKDSDFVDSHILLGRPEKLLVISTGNIANADLETLLKSYLPQIVREFGRNTFLELGRTGLIVRG